MPATHSPESFDVAVVGAGPGGYVAAIRCAQLGLKTACVDDRAGAGGVAAPGGTCLNVGCIPSKALLDSSEQYHRLCHQFAAHGIRADNPSIDLAAMHARKDDIVGKLTGGIGQLFKANGIRFIHGRARLGGGRELAVSGGGDGAVSVRAEHIILAPGSLPVELAAIPFDHERVVDSTDALGFAGVPARLGIIGAGVIGLELGSVWRRLGAEVVVLEALDEFLAAADRQIAREAARQFKRQGLDIQLGATVERVERGDAGVCLHYRQAGAAKQVEVERVIVAVGRRAAGAGLLGEGCGVGLTDAGLIEVDAACRTAAPQVWAIGDAVRGPMLAHKASEEGMAVAERIHAAATAGAVASVTTDADAEFNTVPWVIYTAPEIAWVGPSEAQLQARGVPLRCGTFPFAATGRALAMAEPGGLVKLIAHATTDRLLAAHIVGAHASELIGECVLAMEFGASAEDLARTIHAHPTLSEAVHEAALAVDGRAIHKA